MGEEKKGRKDVRSKSRGKREGREERTRVKKEKRPIVRACKSLPNLR